MTRLTILLLAGALLAQAAAQAPEPPAEDSPLKARPLFSPSRRGIPPPDAAPPVQPDAPPVETNAPNWQLVGVVLEPPRRIAIFKDNSTGEAIRLTPGETRDGWTVVSVGRFSATVSNGKTDVQMKFAAPDPGAVAPLAEPAPGEPGTEAPPPPEGGPLLDPTTGAANSGG